MTLPPKLEKLIDNWPAKVIAFCLALFLYAYYQMISLDSRVLTVPLEIRGVSGTVNVGQVDKYIRVTIRGDSADINHLGREDFSAWVDLSDYLEAGTVNARVHLDLSEQAVALEPLSVEISPSEISVQLDSRKAQFVPVQPVLVGSVPYGYEVANVSASPSQVRVVGAANLVDSVASIDTDGVFLDNHTETFTATVKPYTHLNGLEWDSADAVDVTVEIQPVINDKTFSNVSLAILNVNNQMEYEIQTRRGSITLTGTQLNLDRYATSPVGLFIDGSSINGSGKFKVPVVAGVSKVFTVKDWEPKEVVVVAQLIEPETEPEAEPVPELEPEKSAGSDEKQVEN